MQDAVRVVQKHVGDYLINERAGNNIVGSQPETGNDIAGPVKKLYHEHQHVRNQKPFYA
jgi:hypothetical protein